MPVVFAFSGDPVVAGIVQSLARPGGNATGMSFMSVELNPKRIDFLRTMLPACRKIALLSNARHFGEENEIAACQRTVEGVGIELSVWRSKSRRLKSVVGQALEAAPRRWSSCRVVHGPAGGGDLRPVHGPQRARRLGLGEPRPGRRAPDLRAQPRGAYKRIGFYVVRVLGGAAPANLPIEQPTAFELVINKKTANTLGLTVPVSLLAQADEVIE